MTTQPEPVAQYAIARALACSSCNAACRRTSDELPRLPRANQRTNEAVVVAWLPSTSTTRSLEAVALSLSASHIQPLLGVHPLECAEPSVHEMGTLLLLKSTLPRWSERDVGSVTLLTGDSAWWLT